MRFFYAYRIARAGAHHSELNPSGGKAPVASRRQGSEFQEIPPTPAPSFGPSLRPPVPFSNLPYSPAGGVASCGTTKPSCHSRNCKDLRFSGRDPKNKKWIGLGGNQDPKPCLVRQKKTDAGTGVAWLRDAGKWDPFKPAKRAEYKWPSGYHALPSAWHSAGGPSPRRWEGPLRPVTVCGRNASREGQTFSHSCHPTNEYEDHRSA